MEPSHQSTEPTRAEMEDEINERKARIAALRAQRQGNTSTYGTQSGQNGTGESIASSDEVPVHSVQKDTTGEGATTNPNVKLVDTDVSISTQQDSHHIPQLTTDPAFTLSTSYPHRSDDFSLTSQTTPKKDSQNGKSKDSTTYRKKNGVCRELQDDIHSYLVKADARTNNSLAKILQSKYNNDNDIGK